MPTKHATTTNMVLEARTAGELMVSNPQSISQRATVKEAIVFLTEKGFGAAPVIDDAGRPVGVVSRSDIVLHDRELGDHGIDEGGAGVDVLEEQRLASGFHIEHPDYTPVRDIMTPTVFTVRVDTPARDVVTQMLQHKVHRLFVLDGDGIMVGVISARDVLRHLK